MHKPFSHLLFNLRLSLCGAMAWVSVLCLAGIAQAQDFSNCGGPSQAPCQISTWSDLDAIRTELGKSYVLANNLDENSDGYATYAGPSANGGTGWLPIGGWQNEFIGSFDGGGYSISGLRINQALTSSDEVHFGLFGFVGEPIGPRQGEIKDVRIEALTYTVSCNPFPSIFEINLGAVIGFKQQSVDAIDLSAEGSIEVDLADCGSFLRVNLGGLVGFNRGMLSVGRSKVAIEVINAAGTDRDFLLAGGVVGWNQGTVDRVASEASITAPVAGGIIGFNDSTLLDSYSVGAVTGEIVAGGVIGSNQGQTVSRVYSSGALTLTGTGDSAAIIGHPIVTPSTIGGVFWNAGIITQVDATLGSGLTDAQMRQTGNFTGWDFSETGPWTIKTNLDNPEAWSYPYLRALDYDAIDAAQAVNPAPGLELACGTGQFGTTGYGSCQQCPAGQIAPAPATTQCTLCPKGFFQPDPGQVTCLQCSSGETTSGLGSTACVSNLLFQDRFQVLPL